MLKRIDELVTKVSSSIKASDLQFKGDYPVYGAQGLAGYSPECQTRVESLAVIKDGAGVGRVQKVPAYSSVIGTMQLLIPQPGNDVDYLRLLLAHLKLGSRNFGATIPHIYFKDYGKILTKYRSLSEQQTISHTLTHIENAISKSKSILTSLDELIKSRFIERRVCA